MLSRSKVVYAIILLIVSVAVYCAQYLDVDANVEGYSLASTADLEQFEESQKDFTTNNGGESIVVLENLNLWNEYQDFVSLKRICDTLKSTKEVDHVTSIVSLVYPRKFFQITRKQPFINVNSKRSFDKRFEDLRKYQDITTKFLSEDKRYSVIYIKRSDRGQLSNELVQFFKNYLSSDSDIIPHFIRHDRMEKSMEDTIRFDLAWLSSVSLILILVVFVLLTKSIRGVFLLGSFILLNVSLTLLFAVSLGISLNVQSVTVPCIIVVLSFTDIMHMLYYQHYYNDLNLSNQELRYKIISVIGRPMLITSLTNIIGFVVFLLLSENQLLFNFALLAIVGVVVAYLSSRFLALYTICESPTYLKRTELRKLNMIGGGIRSVFSRNKFWVITSSFVLASLLVILVIKSSKINSFDENFVPDNLAGLEGTRILKEEFFGDKQFEFIVHADSGRIYDHLNELQEVEHLINSTFDTYFVNSPVLIAKRYNRFNTNGIPESFRLPSTLNTEVIRQMSKYKTELGGGNIFSKDEKQCKIVFGVGNSDLAHSLAILKELELACRKVTPKLRLNLSGRDYLDQKGTYDFTVKVLIGLILGLLFGGILIFSFLRSWWKGIGVTLVNLIPIFLAIQTMNFLNVDISPVSLFFLSLLAGICLDDSVYIVTQKQGSSRMIHSFPIVVTSLVMSIGFLALLFSDFEWIRPFSLVFLVGIASAYILDIFVLPLFFKPVKNSDDQ